MKVLEREVPLPCYALIRLGREAFLLSETFGCRGVRHAGLRVFFRRVFVSKAERARFELAEPQKNDSPD
jgi:hypothetical protein